MAIPSQKTIVWLGERTVLPPGHVLYLNIKYSEEFTKRVREISSQLFVSRGIYIYIVYIVYQTAGTTSPEPFSWIPLHHNFFFFICITFWYDFIGSTNVFMATLFFFQNKQLTSICSIWKMREPFYEILCTVRLIKRYWNPVNTGTELW